MLDKIKYYIQIIQSNKYIKYIIENFNKIKTNWLYWTYIMHFLYFIKLVKSTYQIAIFTFYLMSFITVRDMFFTKKHYIYLLITFVKVFIPFVIFALFRNKESNNLLLYTITIYIAINYNFLLNKIKKNNI